MAGKILCAGCVKAGLLLAIVCGLTTWLAAAEQEAMAAPTLPLGVSAEWRGSVQEDVAGTSGDASGETVGTGDGRIHVIPSLSSPSVKNGGKLSMQAVVKAVAGVASVQARIERGGAEPCRALAVATVPLRPAPMNLGGVNGPGTLGLWQAEWAAQGLEEGYYRVALTVTDRTGHAYTDRSLRFSDPIAGNNTVGSTNYPNGGMRRLDVADLAMAETELRTAVLDSANGYAYFGTATSPGIVVKVSLGSGANPPMRVGAVTLNSGEDYLYGGVIDAANGYAYFGTATSPGRVVKVALGTGADSPTRVGAVTLNSGENTLYSGVIDTANGYAYFGTYTAPGRVVKVALGNGTDPPTRVDAVTLNAGENSIYGACAIDPTSGYAYFGTYTSPGIVVKVALGSGASPPTRAGAVTLVSGEGDLHSAVIDIANGYVYFATNESPGRVVKIALGSGASPPTRVGAVTLDTGENYLGGAGIDTSNGYAYFGSGTSPGRVVKVALGSGANPPTRVGAVTLNTGENNLYSGVVDASGGYAYFGTAFGTNGDKAVKVALGSGMAAPSRVGAATLATGELLGNIVIDSTNGYAYWGTCTAPGKVIKLSLGSGATPPTRVGALTLNAGEDYLITAVIDAANGYAYFGTKTVPGRVVKVALGSGDNLPTRVGALTLNGGENYLCDGVIDAVNGYAYFGTNTYPGSVVKVALGTGDNPPTRVGTVTLNSGEDGLVSAVIDEANGYAYFGTATRPGRVVKVALGSGTNPPTRVWAVTLNTGENELYGDGVIDAVNGYAYFGTWTIPGIVVKVALGSGANPPARVGALSLNASEEYLSGAVIDPAGGYAYFGTQGNEVVKVALGSGAESPTRVGALTFDQADGWYLTSAGIDTTTGLAYFGIGASNPGKMVRVALSEQGLLKATRLTMPQAGVLSTVSFYSHAAAGHTRFALYDNSASPALLWQSGAVSNEAAEDWLEVAIGDGSPASLQIPAGAYWLAWQTDTTVPVPSYAAGASGDGLFVPLAFGAFPSSLEAGTSTALTLTDERWSAYLTYDTPAPNPPVVSGVTPTADTTPTWSWTSGGGGGNGTFRYQLDGEGGTWTQTTATSYTPATALSEAWHTLYVQERDDAGNWSTSGSFVITIDTTAPTAPSVTGTTPTNDTTPTWSWVSGGGGGNGTCRYKLDNSNLTTGATQTAGTSYTPSSPLTAAVHTLYVQERDAAGNWSSSGSFVITIDATAPTVTMSSTASQPTNVSSIAVTVTFSESVTGFAAGDVLATNGAVSGFSGSGASYSFDLTPSGQGGVTADIAADVCQDAAGNGNTAAPQFSRTFDSIAPTVLMDSTASEPTSTSPIPVTVTFSESVTGFDATDITTSNGALQSFAGSGAAYSFDLVPAGQGVVTADIAAGACQDAAGNANTAASQFSRTYNTNPILQTWYVDTDNVAGPWDGLTWATAFQTIQEGVNAAYTAGGGEVWVAEGTYTGAVDPVVTMRDNVDIYGGFIGIGLGGGETSREQRDWRSHVSAIDGQGARRCVLGADNATLDGFTVTAGFADIGGGMYNHSVSPTVANCIFTGNSTGSVDGWGGGGIGNVDSSPIITDCVFSDNSAGWGGGGIHNLGSSPEVSRCVFANNETTFQGGGGGGGICYADTSSGTVTNCTFQGNSGDNGGGIYITAESVPELVNCTFTENSFRSNGGGAICINQIAAPLVTNCIFWGDEPVEISPGYTVTYSLVQGGYPGTGNINGDPRFVNAAAGDLRLRTGSPCIDSGTTGPDEDIAGISRPQRAGWDMGAHEFVTAVLSIVRRSANPTRGTTVGYTVTFNEAVTGVDKTDFTLATTGVTGAYVYSVSGTGATRTVTVATGTGNGTIRLDVRDDDTIVNASGNPLGGVGVGNGDYTKGETYTVDKTRPTVSLWSLVPSTTNASPIPVVVTFSEPVTGFVATDITVVNAKVSNFAGSGAAYTFDLVPVGDGTVTARVLAGVAGDAAGNVNLASNTLTRTFDGTPPHVVSIVRTSANPTRATSVLYRVTFSGVVTGVDATDFALTTTGVSGAYVYSVSGTGAVYTVRVATGAGSGTIRLDVVDDDSIKDIATNPLGGAGAGNGNFTAGEVYTVDKTRPTVSMSSTASNPTNVSPIPVTVLFSEPVTGFVATDIVATNGSVSNFAGSGANYSFDLVPGVPGTVRADIPAGRAQDAAGNTNTAAPSFIRTYQP